MSPISCTRMIRHVRSTAVRRACGRASLSPARWPSRCHINAAPTDDVQHVIVWREAGRYGGWPANHGMWAWGDEILVGFSGGYMAPQPIGAGGPARHPIDRTRPEQHLLARSTDGGAHWTIEHPEGLRPPSTTGHMAGVPTERGPAATAFGGCADLSDPDFVMTFRMGSADTGPSWFFVSPDRGRAWKGPFAFPDLGLKGIAARTDYLPLGRQEALAFLTATKSDGKEGRLFVARTTDGGTHLRVSLVDWRRAAEGLRDHAVDGADRRADARHRGAAADAGRQRHRHLSLDRSRRDRGRS